MIKRNMKKSGFTMIEATIAMVILAIAAAGILLPFGSAAAAQDEGAKQVIAANLATELMEIVLQTAPGNIIATYNGYSESQGAMLDFAGVVYSDSLYSKYSRNVQCVSGTTASVNMVVVTVRVYYDSREMTQLTTMVKN